MINVHVNEKCNGCGGCLNSDYFEEMDNGDVQTKAGVIISDNALDELTRLSQDCPCQAIVIESKNKTEEEITKELRAYVEQIKDVEHVNLDDVKLDENRHSIRFDYHISYGEDGFSSYDRAYSALRSEIHNIWDDRKDYALSEAQKYVNNDLRKFWDVNYPNGIYVETQNSIKNAVHAISNGLMSIGAIKDSLSEKNYRVEFTEWTTRWLLEPECLSKEWAQAVYDRLDYNSMLVALHKSKIEPYQDYVDGLFGKVKEKTMWGYSQGYNSEENIGKQIVHELRHVSYSGAKKAINEIIDEYNKQLEEIRKKLDDLIDSNRKKIL